MDTSEEVKIWRRVRSESPGITDGLPALAAGALGQAALYGAMARRHQGQMRQSLLQLQSRELSNARCLKGIFRLITGQSLSVATVPPVQDAPEIALRKSYGRSLKALKAYEARSDHEEYGAIFRLLADRQREDCFKIAELAALSEV